MKSLEPLLSSLYLRSTIQNRVVLGEPWGVAFPACGGSGKFHFIEEGRGILKVPGRVPVFMHQGDLAIVFSQGEHVVQDVTETPPTPLFDLVARAQVICRSGLTLQFGGEGAQTSVISGDFDFRDSSTHPLIRMLPEYFLIKGHQGKADPGLEATLSLLSCESMRPQAGVNTVLDRLCDVLFIQALRGWMRSDRRGEGWPAAVRDRAIDEALDLMQRQPAHPWTVESLADRVSMSRSTFADRFRRLLGDTPMEYLTGWRMHLAAQELRSGAESVAIVAERVGYESEAAFARAFKRKVGVSPGAFRRAEAL